MKKKPDPNHLNSTFTAFICPRVNSYIRLQHDSKVNSRYNMAVISIAEGETYTDTIPHFYNSALDAKWSTSTFYASSPCTAWQQFSWSVHAWGGVGVGGRKRKK